MSPNPTDFELGVKLTKLEQSIENLQESHKRVLGDIAVYRQSNFQSYAFDSTNYGRLEFQIAALRREQAEFGFLGRISRWWNRSHWRELQQRMSALESKQHMDNAELNATLDGIKANLDEASTEIVKELQSLREQVANGGQPTETIARLEALSVAAKKLADIIPGSPAPVDPAPSA